MTNKLIAITILLMLTIWSQCFADVPKWYNSKDAEASISFRAPKYLNIPIDFEVAGGVSDSASSTSAAIEREDDTLYVNYQTWHRFYLYRNLALELKTVVKPAWDINTQSVFIGWKFFGYGAIVDKYQPENIKDSFYFRIDKKSEDKKKYLNLQFITDFDGIHIWNGKAEYQWETKSSLKPSVIAVVNIDGSNPLPFYQLKFGLKYSAKD